MYKNFFIFILLGLSLFFMYLLTLPAPCSVRCPVKSTNIYQVYYG